VQISQTEQWQTWSILTCIVNSNYISICLPPPTLQFSHSFLGFRAQTQTVIEHLFHAGIILEAEASLNQAQISVSDSET
jgi:hypothetical protein